jgi:adenylate cyclase class IV
MSEKFKPLIDPQAKTMRLLKVTKSNGSEQYYPGTPQNLKWHQDYMKRLSLKTRENYKFEEVEVSLEKAAELGFNEAIQILNPKKTKSAPSAGNDAVMAELLRQNAMLMERLSALESPKTKTAKS